MTPAELGLTAARPVLVPREGLDAVPTFHAWGEGPAADELATTGCGLRVRWYSHLRADHALAIGRPCRRCWPCVPQE